MKHKAVVKNLCIGTGYRNWNSILTFTSQLIFPKLLFQVQFSDDVQAGFRKGRGTRDQIANICWITEKAREFQKTSTSASLTKLKPLTEWITTNCGKFWKRWEYQATLPDSWEICMQVKKQQLEPDMEERTGSKLGKEYVKDVYCYPAYLTYMQST